MNKTQYPRIGETILQKTLPNGLRVIIVPKPDYRKSYAFFATRYGGMDMRFCLDGTWRDTPAGIAHYLEHKMFDTEEGNALQILTQNGADPNAFTSNALTAYYFDCTEKFAENLRTLLSFVSVPYFTEESVEKERGIIAQEIRMVEDTPDWMVYTRLMESMYRDNPVRVAIAGTVESIGEITAQTLYDCHKAFYTPSNMVLCVVGNVDSAEVLAITEEILPQTAADAPIPRDYGAEEKGIVQKRTELSMEVSMPQFLLGFKCDTVDGGDALLRQNLLADMCCDILLGDSSPLYKKLYESRLVNGTFGASFDQYPGAAHLCAGGDSNDPDTVMQEIISEARRLCDGGIDNAFYEQIRRSAFGQSLRSLNSFENIAYSLADGYFRNFDPFRFPEVFADIRKSDVEAFLRENITEERSALSVIYPKKEGM